MTNFKKNQSSLKKSDERFRTFMKHTTEAIWCIELDPPVAISLPEDERHKMSLERRQIWIRQ